MDKVSAGVVVLRSAPEGWRVLLLRAYRNWDFPKGMLDPGETPFAAAARETREETGLTDLVFHWGETHCDTEPYAGGKVARYFLAETRSGDAQLAVNPVLGRAEHHELRWLGFEAARPLLVPRLQRVLDWARETSNRLPGERLNKGATPPCSSPTSGEA
jgi:8-oxo-dGTP pyrophosphatase MutT (NUDIX family)